MTWIDLTRNRESELRTTERTTEPSPIEDLRKRLADSMADPFLSESIFDHLDDIVYFVKDCQGRYVIVNETLAKRCGASHKSELIGKTSREVFGDAIGSRFSDQDAAVIQSREPLIDELELHAYSAYKTGWCLTTKLPLLGHEGQVVGLVGISRDLRSPGDDAADLDQLATIIEHIKDHLDRPLRVSELADRVGMSAYQLDRRCREVYGISPSQLILQLRMSGAATKLRQSDDSIYSIALASGYSDQSAFTRQFRRTFGIAPGKYRR